MTLTTFLRVLERADLPWVLKDRDKIRVAVHLGKGLEYLNPLTWVILRCTGKWCQLERPATVRGLLPLNPHLERRLWGACENLPEGIGLRKTLIQACKLERL